MARDIVDIAVIGAGPAGSSAAISAARLNRSVCMIDRNARIGFPVRCGEGLGCKSFVQYAGGREEWALNRYERSVMISPSGIRDAIGSIDKPYLLDREKMDGTLAAEAAQSGAELVLSTTVTELRQRSDKRYECIMPGRTIIASIVIIADGVESRLARFLGWNTVLASKDIETCAFCHVESPLIDSSECLFYTGSSAAPGGYAWIFPRGKGFANVGLGISGDKSSAGKARKLLLEFVRRELPGSTMSYLHCGGVPVARYVRPLVRGGAMLAGDAARQVNCMSGAGIGYSLYAGKLAGTTAAGAISQDGTVDYSALIRYEKEWRKTHGRQQERSYALKEFVTKTDDAFLDRIATALAREPVEKMSYLRVFARTFAGNPILLVKALRLFA